MKIFVRNLFLILMFSILLSSKSYAGDYFAFLQFKDPNTGLIQQVFKKCESKWLAKKLNESHWNGVKTSCPDCIKEFDSCIKKLPSSVEGIFENKQIIFPYLSSKKDRIIYLGVPMDDAIRVAKWMENAYKTKLNRPAKAIMPLDLTK
jgi:hypothetical protein